MKDRRITARYEDGIANAMNATPVDMTQSERNIAARVALIEEFGASTTDDLIGSGVQPDAQMLSVEYRDRMVYPRFQFDDHSRLLPVIADVLALLRDVRSPWEIALWFTAANGWLGGRRPADLLRSMPQRVLEAARYEAQPRVF